jgi:hypothetical protein
MARQRREFTPEYVTRSVSVEPMHGRQTRMKMRRRPNLSARPRRPRPADAEAVESGGAGDRGRESPRSAEGAYQPKARETDRSIGGVSTGPEADSPVVEGSNRGATGHRIATKE